MDSTHRLAVEFERQLEDLRDSVEIQYLDENGKFLKWRGYVGDPNLSIRFLGLISPRIFIAEKDPEEMENLTVIPLSRVIVVTVSEFDRNIDTNEDDPYRPVATWVQYDGELLQFSR